MAGRAALAPGRALVLERLLDHPRRASMQVISGRPVPTFLNLCGVCGPTTTMSPGRRRCPGRLPSCAPSRCGHPGLRSDAGAVRILAGSLFTRNVETSARGAPPRTSPCPAAPLLLVGRIGCTSLLLRAASRCDALGNDESPRVDDELAQLVASIAPCGRPPVVTGDRTRRAAWTCRLLLTSASRHSFGTRTRAPPRAREHQVDDPPDTEPHPATTNASVERGKPLATVRTSSTVGMG